MAQAITLWGASYTNVPGVDLPKTGGGTARFTDTSPTTAGDSDVASGKIYFKSDGSQSTGTASGGASNIVQGNFTTGSSRNTTGSVSIPYTGSGDPIAMMVYIHNGAYNSGTGGDTTWYNSTNRYDVGAYYMTKSRANQSAQYGTSGVNAQGVVAIIYKNSTTNSTSYTRTSSMTANVYSTSDATASTVCVRFKGNGKTISYYVGNKSSDTIGLAPSTTYDYIVIYTS